MKKAQAIYDAEKNSIGTVQGRKAERMNIEYLIYDGGARIRFWVPPNFPSNCFILQMMCIKNF
jgi:hypothetical protein